MTRFFTFKKAALARLRPGQKLRFTARRGYWLFGKAVKKVVPRRQFTMYDSVTVSQIPKDAAAVAGYVNGHWPTYQALVSEFPRAKRLSIAVNAHADAVCLDVEQGDATPAEAPAWVRRQQMRGVKKPVVYCSVSQAPAVLRELERHGIRRKDIRLWTAHYTFKAHRCSKRCGFGFTGRADATQYHDHALARNLDASLCAPSFLD